MRKPASKTSPKQLKLAEALNTIYKATKHSGIPEKLFVDLKDELKVVCDFVQCEEK